MGRKKIELNEEDQKTFYNCAKIGLTMEQISEVLGIKERGLWVSLKRDKKLNALYKKAKSEAIKNVAGGLYAGALKGNVASQIFYLKTQAHWKEGIQLDNKISGELNTNIKLNKDFIKELSAEFFPKPEQKKKNEII